MEEYNEPLSFAYKHVDDKPSFVDVFLPSPSSTTEHLRPVPGIVYFHGGGLTVGSRKSYFPHWMHKRAMRAGYAFLSADYQLLAPSTAHDVLSDVTDLFGFLAADLNGLLAASGKTRVQIDASALVASGSSAGAFCTYFAALHATPKPKAVVTLYGMGGDLLTPQYLAVKTAPFFLGREMLDPDAFRTFLHPFPPGLRPTADSPLAYHPPTSATPGLPANPRMPLCRLLLQEGVFLDYYTGVHTPSLSARLRGVLGLTGGGKGGDPGAGEDVASAAAVEAAAREFISARDTALFPQLCIDRAFPSTFLVHGGADTAVHADESRNMKRLLDAHGVRTVLRVVDKEEHSFDYAPDAEERFGALFNEVFDFLGEVLGGKPEVDPKADR